MVRVERLSQCRVNFDGSKVISVNINDRVVAGIALLGSPAVMQFLFARHCPRLCDHIEEWKKHRTYILSGALAGEL